MKILFTLVFSLLALHPMHISVTEIKFDEKDKALEIMMRVFIDDLENTMRKKINEPELDILNPKKGITVDQLMRDYIPQHFKISLDNKTQTINYLGHERDGDVFIFYVEVEKVKKFKTIQVQNDLLMEMYDDQASLVHVTVRDVVRSLRLTKDKSIDKLAFEIK